MSLHESIWDFSRKDQKQKVVELIRSLDGKYRLSLVKHRRRRTDRQLKFYWPCFCKLLGDHLREEGNEEITDDAIHAFFKSKFLSKTIVSPKTGNINNIAMSTGDLTTTEFNRYLDQIAAYLVMEFGLIVPEPNIYREIEEPPDYRLIA